MMTWEELRTGVYEIDGSWRDIYVLNATRQDWHQWIKYVNLNYSVRWAALNHCNGETLDAIDADYIAAWWDESGGVANPWGIIYLDKVQLKCHFFTDNEIENDVDPSQIVSMEDHHRLMAYLVAISGALGKEVIVTAENVREGVYVRVNGSNISFT
ncbi:hypothetical protein [uncultured Hymenobacter sp.]|uniref:hypothetical protein n=1 Tax=uncultured Hymenobacter sp. TaxID=170016 RepID=UPI0035C972BD